MYEYHCQIAPRRASSQGDVNILAFTIAFLNESNLRTIIKHLLNLAGVDMMLKRKFIDYVAEPNIVFNLHSQTYRNDTLAACMSKA